MMETIDMNLLSYISQDATVQCFIIAGLMAMGIINTVFWNIRRTRQQEESLKIVNERQLQKNDSRQLQRIDDRE